MLPDQKLRISPRNERQKQDRIGRRLDVKRVAGKQNNGRGGMLSDGGNHLPVRVVDDQTAAYQEKIDGMAARPRQQGSKRVLLDLIGVEQDGKRFPAGFFTAAQGI